MCIYYCGCFKVQVSQSFLDIAGYLILYVMPNTAVTVPPGDASLPTMQRMSDLDKHPSHHILLTATAQHLRPGSVTVQHAHIACNL